MIQLLAIRYKKHIAYTLGLILYTSFFVPVYGMPRRAGEPGKIITHPGYFNKKSTPASVVENTINNPVLKKTSSAISFDSKQNEAILEIDKVDIDGPSQPEMSSFKPSGTNDMVNLFTGDFSYNIPLLDVGGYPVNIFYNGGISMEQEASWVGLGWNINPGNVNRTMRGVPDDFNGEDKLIQEQNMKKNVTWGVSLGADFELFGMKKFLGFFGNASMGISVNNYLGPALEMGLKGGTSFSLTGKAAPEKSPYGASIGLSTSLNLSSRNGLTISPGISLSASSFQNDQKLTAGLGLSTSYNSRAGIKGLQLSGQVTNSMYTPDGTNWSNVSRDLFGTTISFTKPSYVPALRSSITNSSGAGRFQIGPGMFGNYTSAEIEGYGQVSSIEPADRVLVKPMVGYIYAEKAVSNRDAVMDFNRLNDQEVTPTTSIISAPQYAYDVFSIQGEGTGGSIRAYRNDNGYVRDNYTGSKDKSWSGGVDIGIPGHFGTNFNTVKTPTTIGEWNNGNKLRNTIGFGSASGDRENVYFRNPGENSVLHANQFDSIGNANLVRFKLGGTNFSPTIEPKLQVFNSSGQMVEEKDVQRSIGFPEREKRTQVTNFLTAGEAAIIGLDKKIKSYNSNPSSFLDGTNKLNFTELDRVTSERKSHHISQISVTESDGKRYVYGVPVYNIIQKDFSFTVADLCNNCDLVGFSSNETSISASPHLTSPVGGKDGYVQVTTTPAYAHSFLLSGLLSPDYVDVNGDGITEDDLGGAVKFNYTKIAENHKWRTPYTNGMLANSNPGTLSETKDDKGIVSYGERESWYLHSVESKTMIAFFTLEDRADGNGVVNEYNGINYSDNSLKRLKQIDLYNKADLKKNGMTGAKPVKTVHFGYSYTLCPQTPDLSSVGKLTLDKIWFTYNGQTRASKNQYLFEYSSGTQNPAYAVNTSDRWGNYKPVTNNPVSMMNRNYPYATQDKTTADHNAAAWGLKKILLPSGGKLEVEYESDDYAFVQNKRAALMLQVIGFGSTPFTATGNLYSNSGNGSITEHDYVFIKVPQPCSSPQEVFQKYLQGITQLSVKLKVNMPKGPEYLTSYATFSSEYGVYYGAGVDAIYVRLNKVNGISPLTQTAIEFLRQQLPGQAFPGFDVSDSQGIEQVLNMLAGWLDGIKSAFANIPEYLKSKGYAKSAVVNESFVRLNDPDGYKYGGGHRVKTVKLWDNWKRMTEQYNSFYGQQYDYTTKEVFNGIERTISSGVASYEPSIGGEENPFQTIIQVANDVPLGPTSYGAIEMPMLDAFFPAPLVGYSKVTVTSLGKTQNPEPATKKTRSGVGRQVTEFYTAKDFPVYYTHTALDPASDKQEHVNPTLAFFYKYAFDGRAISQGFLVATNDMHGKMKSQSSYAENDPNTRINYTENFYRNTGVKGFDDKFDFVHHTHGGEVIPGNMGIDIELMTDTREFSVGSRSFEFQGQVDWITPFPFPIWIPFIWGVLNESKNVYRAVTTTKVISYHSVLDSVVVIDKGSQVSTKNLVYDAETGQVVVNRTNNEYDKAIYTVNYPAYWAYSGMGLAYKNIDAVYSGVKFVDGVITTGITTADIKKIFESGDELYIIDPGPSNQVTNINGTVSLGCSDVGCTQQGLTSITFNFSSPTPAPLTVQVGQINHAVGPNTYRATGYDIFTMPPEVTPDNYYSPYQNLPFTFSIPQGITSISFPGPINIAPGGSAWICHNCLFPTTALYIKGFSSGNQHQTVFTTSQGYTVNNISVNTTNCTIPDTDTNERLIWAFNKNKHTTSLTDVNPQFIFIDKSGKPYTRSDVKFRIVRSGKRNILGAPLASVSMMTNPVAAGTNILTYTPTSKVINTAAVEYKEKWQTDNDVFNRYIGVLNQVNCTVTMQPNCNGELETSINPYRKGLLGNFKSHRNMIFYGERQQTDPVIATNLPENGFLSGFGLYWNFDGNSNLVPDLSNTKWVWNTEGTRFNSKGMELEARDALNIYTAAQYGYSKTLPLAITNNSRQHEMFFEGFEDYYYNDLLNNATYNTCAKRFIDFSNLPTAQIYTSAQLGFNAHTGNTMLQVSSTTTKILPVGVAPAESIPLQMQTATNETLNGIGQNFFRVESSGTGATSIQVPFNTNTVGINDQVALGFGYNSDYTMKFYLRPNATGIYSLNSFVSENGGRYDLAIYSVENLSAQPVLVYSFSQPDGGGVPSSQTYTNNPFSLYMCAGKFYFVELTYYPHPSFITYPYYWPPGSSNNWCGFNYYFSLGEYESLQSVGGACNYTVPIPATESMLNSTFLIPPGKQMVFSAWVKESGQQTTDNSVQINWAGSSGPTILQPSGPVIEGWQRYEGYFTVPASASQMELKLVNNNGSPIYFDDIRIHPFNSNMKSYVYDPVNLRLLAELDANNYASFYEYDEEGTLIRTKIETKQGVKTVTESRSAKQKNIADFQ